MNELHFAVVIGIDCYPGVSNQLTTAKADAEAFAKWLISADGGGLPSENVASIAASRSEEEHFSKAGYVRARPILNDVYIALSEFHDTVANLDAKSWERTRLYIYVAGHGLVPPAGRGAILFANARPPQFWGDPLDLGAYERLYDRFTPFRDVILLADCCREIAAGMPAIIDPPWTGPVRGSTNCILGFATEHGRKAGAPSAKLDPLPDHGRGFFTKAILEGLRGAAPHDPFTGAITSDGLAYYVRGRVPALAHHYGYTQHAEIQRVRGEVEFVRVPVELFDVEIRTPLGSASGVEISGGAGQTVTALPPQTDGQPSVVSLPNGLYQATLRSGDERVFKVQGGGCIVQF